eukprot:4480827-Pleurochrysis_carterae.AAC.1
MSGVVSARAIKATVDATWSRPCVALPKRGRVSAALGLRPPARARQNYYQHWQSLGKRANINAAYNSKHACSAAAATRLALRHRAAVAAAAAAT